MNATRFYRVEIQNKMGGAGHIDMSDSTVDASLRSAASCLGLRANGSVTASVVADLYFLRCDGAVLFAASGGGDAAPLVREHNRRFKHTRAMLAK